MEAMEAILSRRSIRRYTTELVSENNLHELLDAAMAAPSSAHGQPWHFVAITDRKTLDEIPKFHQYSRIVRQRPRTYC